MADLGTVTEIVNATELTLEVGLDTYILLTDLQINVSRPEDRTATTDGGVLYTYGKGDHSFTATLVVTTPELSTLNTLNTLDSDGDMTSTAWKIVAANKAGATKTFAATGVLTGYTVRKPEAGLIEIDISVRITGDTITIS